MSQATKQIEQPPQRHHKASGWKHHEQKQKKQKQQAHTIQKKNTNTATSTKTTREAEAEVEAGHQRVTRNTEATSITITTE